jgi:hypothetical protein
MHALADTAWNRPTDPAQMPISRRRSCDTAAFRPQICFNGPINKVTLISTSPGQALAKLSLVSTSS